MHPKNCCCCSPVESPNITQATHPWAILGDFKFFASLLHSTGLGLPPQLLVYCQRLAVLAYCGYFLGIHLLAVYMILAGIAVVWWPELLLYAVGWSLSLIPRYIAFTASRLTNDVIDALKHEVGSMLSQLPESPLALVPPAAPDSTTAAAICCTSLAVALWKR